jgi:DNA-binding transcriptional LysR family regulator
MDRLDAMALFVTVADEGSLAAAARRHGRSAATVTRAVALLENHVGEPLLLRSTRKLSLTAAGERHLAIWRDVLEVLDGAASPNADEPLRGSIVLTTPELFGRLKLMPLIETFLRTHANVGLRALMVNRIVNLVGEGVDLAIRLAPLPDSNLSAIRIGQVRSMLCASPDYLDRTGAPQSPGELTGHDCIGLNAESDGELWPFDMSDGRGTRVRSVRVHTRLSVDSAAAAIDAALRGHGIISARSYQVADHIAAGRLVRLLSGFEGAPVPVHIVFPADRAERGAVRAFIDHIEPPLKRELREVESKISMG